MCVASEFTDAQATGVLRLLKDRNINPENIRFNTAAGMRAHIKRNAESELVHRVSLKKSERDGKNTMELAFRNVWQASKQLAESPDFAHKMYLKPETRTRPSADGSTTERVFGPYNTGLFFHAMQDHFGPDITIMFIHLFSDETETGWKGSKYPIYGKWFSMCCNVNHNYI